MAIKVRTRNQIKLDTQTQFALVIFIILLSLAIIYLFDILLAPLVFLLYGVWIVMNPGKSLTGKEMSGLFVIVLPFLMYSMSARIAGMIFGIILVIIYEIFFTLLYSGNRKIKRIKTNVKR